MGWILALLFWTAIPVLLSLETLFRYNQIGHDVSFWEVLPNPLLNVYLWLMFFPAIRRLSNYFFWRKGQRIRNILRHLPWAILIPLVHLILYYELNFLIEHILDFRYFFEGSQQRIMGNLVKNVMVYWVIFGYLSARRYRRGLTNEQIKTMRLERELLESKIEAIKLRLNPHFLFNTLNSIAVLIKTDAEKAGRMIRSLGDFLRQVLEGMDRLMIPLREELDQVGKYLEIEQVRFGDRLKVEYDIEPECNPALVPNLILQPLVENSLFHTVAPSVSGGEIRVEARRHSEQLVIRVLDRGYGEKRRTKKKGMGLGLTTIRRRLAFEYGKGRTRVSWGRSQKQGFTVTMGVPFMVEETNG